MPPLTDPQGEADHKFAAFGQIFMTGLSQKRAAKQTIHWLELFPL
jgi:hypothetical protein